MCVPEYIEYWEFLSEYDQRAAKKNYDFVASRHLPNKCMNLRLSFDVDNRRRFFCTHYIYKINLIMSTEEKKKKNRQCHYSWRVQFKYEQESYNTQPPLLRRLCSCCCRHRCRCCSWIAQQNHLRASKQKYTKIDGEFGTVSTGVTYIQSL